MNKWLYYLFLVLPIVYAIPSQALHPRCPKECICTSDSVATCSTLDLEPFGLEILQLNIINPEKEIKLGQQVFKTLSLSSLRRLNVDNATIAELDDSAFNGVKYLGEIVIRNSIIPEIPTSLFDQLSHLHKIDLSNSKLTNFVDIQSNVVEELVLKGCEIREINKNTFSECPSLTYLSLQNNSIEHFELSDVTFESLNLSRNNISNFTLKNSQLLDNLVTLDLSYNPIVSFEPTGLNLEKLFMKSCNLKNVDFLSKLTNDSGLINLDLSDNEISELNDHTLDNLGYLETLDLSNNKLTKLSPTAFKNNVQLSKFILDKNNLKTLPVLNRSYISFRLEYFSCASCGLETLHEKTFENFASTQTIILNNNQLNDLPARIFNYIPGLVKIDLSDNRITKLDENIFTKNLKLRNVNLSGNPLKIVSAELFKKNLFLTTLDISNCMIQNLWESSDKLTELPLQNLIAENNLISVVTVDELAITKNLKSLALSGNRLVCNSVFADMRKWLNTNSVNTLKVSDEITSKPSDVLKIKKSWLEDCGNIDDEDDDYSYNYDNASEGAYEADSKDYKKEPVYDEFDKSDEEEIDKNDDIKNYPDTVNMKPVHNIYPEDNYDNIDEEKQIHEDIEDVMSIEDIRFQSQQTHREIIVFLLPTLVFVLTALVVLILTVSVILCLIQKRNRRSNAPQIKISPWGYGTKIKKHSGSVYRPLSEERIVV